MDKTLKLKDILNLSSFGVSTSIGNQSNQYEMESSVSAINCSVNGQNMNDLNMNMPSNNLMHNLPNNCTIRVDSSSTKSQFNVYASKAANEGRESTNSYFAKIERLVEYNWSVIDNINLIAVNNRKALIAYVLNQTNRTHRSFSSPKNANISPDTRSQMIRVMNYENISIRCLDKGVFYSQISDLAFSVNSVLSNSLDIMKLAVADREGNVYIYNIKEENGGLSIERILEIKNNGREHNYVKLSWCPYIPNDDDECEVEGDMGLKLALSCDTTVELFAIDVLQDLYKEAATVDVSKLKISLNCYQIIENAHNLPIISLSIAQDVTAICTAGLDDNIKFYKISLNSPNLPKMLKEWIPNNLEPDDHITCFYFLDDFDLLLSNSEQTFWGHALFGTKNGVLSIIDLKNWRSRQSIKLVCDQLSKSDNGFNYKIDLTSHFVVAVRDNAAFVLHIKFPHDKEEHFNDSEDKTNCDYSYDNSHPYINKVSRFQIYNAPLLSFVVKKSIDGNILIFWITRKTLEVCYIDLSLINIDEFFGSPFEISSTSVSVPNMIEMEENNTIVDTIFTNDKAVTSDENNENTIDLINGTNTNSFNFFDSSIITPIKLNSEPQIKTIIPSPPPPAANTLDAFNMSINMTPPFTNEAMTPPQPFPIIGQQIRPESPASKEIQQILSPSLSHQLKSLSVEINNPQLILEDTEFIKSRAEGDASSSDAIAFPTKLPNILKDLVREDQLFQLKDEMRKEIQDSEMRIIQSLEKIDLKINTKLININEKMMNNSKIQTIILENDIKEMKKELKNACKIRNEEFNKIVEKLVNKVMHEMNVIVQKGFQELIQQLNKEVKQVTAEFEKSGNALQAKLVSSHEKAHFQMRGQWFPN